MVEIEQKKRKELLDWYKDLKAQIAGKGRVIVIDDRNKYKAVDYLNLDGFYPGYYESKHKVLFIEKELKRQGVSNRIDADFNLFSCNNLDETYLFPENPRFPLWHKVFYLSYGIEHEGIVPFESIPSSNEIKEECLRQGRFPFAFIRLSKYTNFRVGYKSDLLTTEMFLEDAELKKRNFLREQLSILEPDIIVSAGLLRDGSLGMESLQLVFPRRDFSSRLKRLSADGVSDVYDFSFEGKNIRFIDLHHFSAIRVGKLMGYELDKIYYYDPVMKAVFGNQEAVE